MGKAERDKGARFEREVARRFCGIGITAARRGFAQAQKAASDDDVDTGGLFAVECKHQRQPNVRAALAQAVARATGDAVPVAVVRWHGGDEIVAMRGKDWFALVERAHKGGAL